VPAVAPYTLGAVIVEVAAEERVAIADLQYEHKLTPPQANRLRKEIFDAKEVLMAQARGEEVGELPPLYDWLARRLRDWRERMGRKPESAA